MGCAPIEKKAINILQENKKESRHRQFVLSPLQRRPGNTCRERKNSDESFLPLESCKLVDLVQRA